MNFNRVYFAMAMCVLIACSNDDVDTHDIDPKTQAALDDLAEIQSNWDERTEESRADYCYVTSRCSFTGSCYYTEIQVQNHAVVARIYKETLRQIDGSEELVTNWEEDSSLLGSHDDVFASDVSTYDELLVTCEDKYISSIENVDDVSFHINASEEGLLDACVYEMDNCFDDCTTGINIHAFELASSDCSDSY
ncbi:MAG: hypothetical protein IPJ88_15460 [Myxococcales bacterium]|nr:MAG: hypothetical protein IPJ88_15460 [Myxococcales bacterium]